MPEKLFVEVPGLYLKPMLSESDVAREVSRLCQRELLNRFASDVGSDVKEFRRRQLVSRVVDIHVLPFHRAGLTELRKHNIQDVLKRLARDLDQRSMEVPKAAES